MKIDARTAIKQVGHIIDLWMPWKIRYDDTPGISIAIAHKGKILYARGFGYADVKHKIKSDEKTLYHIASHSKMFTSVAVLKLVKQGKLRLDDKVSDYISWFRGKGKHSDASDITIRQVLSHTAGIFRDGDTPHWETGEFPKDLKKSFSPKALVIENLTTFKYTNYGYSLLGLVIEKVSGMSYEDFVKKNILKPLRLEDTYPDYKNDLKHIATGYGAILPGQKRTVFDHYKTNAYAPATGFISNTTDISKFMSALSIHAKTSSLLDKESLKEMVHPHGKTGDGDEYGLGLDIFYLDGKKIIGHGGGFNGFSTRTALDVQNHLSVAVFVNSLDSNATQLAIGIINMFNKMLNDNSQYLSRSKTQFSKYEGMYRSSWGDELVVRVADILVGFSPATNDPFKKAARFVPSGSPHVFTIKNDNLFSAYDEKAVFSRFKNGKARKLVEATMPMKKIR